MRLRRLTTMAVSYLAASCVAACIVVIGILLFASSGSLFAVDVQQVRSIAFLAVLIAAFVAVFALFPFLVAVTYAERKAITSPVWYVVAGASAGVMALASNLVLTAPSGGITLFDLSEHPLFMALTSVAVVAGICAG